MTEFNPRKLFLLNAAVFLGVVLMIGFGLHTLLISIPVALILNVCFAKWSVGDAIQRGASILKRSVSFIFLLTTFSVLWIWTTSPGQLGYGDYLQISGASVTPYGYWVIFLESAKVGLVALIAAGLISFKGLARRETP